LKPVRYGFKNPRHEDVQLVSEALLADTLTSPIKLTISFSFGNI